MPINQATLKAALRESIVLASRQLAELENRYNVKTTVDTYVGEYEDGIRTDYWTSIYESAYDYLSSSDSVTKYRNAARRAVVNSFPTAFYSGYADAGGEETEDDDERWLTARMNKELEFVDDLFASLRDKREDGKLESDEADAEASSRADGYRATLDGIYTEGKLRGAKVKSLEFDGEDGADSCSECSDLKGKRKTIKWILENDAIPRPGNTYFTCGGGDKCKHFWKDPKTGEQYTF